MTAEERPGQIQVAMVMCGLWLDLSHDGSVKPDLSRTKLELSHEKTVGSDLRGLKRGEERHKGEHPSLSKSEMRWETREAAVRKMGYG